MGKSVSIDQSHAIMAALATTVDWSLLDGDLLQEQVIKSPKEVAKHFNRFLLNGARIPVVGDFKVATAEFDLITFIGKGQKIVSEEQDEKSAALPEIDFANARFVSCLDKDKNSIKGEEKLHRLKKSDDIRLGATVFMGLWKDYQEKKENSVLERLYREGIIKSYVDFFGTILLYPNGRRFVLCLYRSDDDKWYWDARWLENRWGSWNLSLVLPQV